MKSVIRRVGRSQFVDKASAPVTSAASSIRSASAAAVQRMDWSAIDHTKFLRAGMHGSQRSLSEAQRVWETLPESFRAAGGNLEGKDWSHKKAHVNGGSGNASNGIFEDASLNRARGGRNMTRREIQAAQSALRGDAVMAVLRESGKSAAKGAAIAALIEGTLSTLEFGLRYRKGEITKAQMLDGIVSNTVRAGVTGGAIAGCVSAAVFAVPAIAPAVVVVSIPLAIVGAASTVPRLAGISGLAREDRARLAAKARVLELEEAAAKTQDALNAMKARRLEQEEASAKTQDALNSMRVRRSRLDAKARVRELEEASAKTQDALNSIRVRRWRLDAKARVLELEEAATKTQNALNSIRVRRSRR